MDTSQWQDLAAVQNTFPDIVVRQVGGVIFTLEPNEVSIPMPRHMAVHLQATSRRVNGGQFRLVEVDAPKAVDPFDLIDKSVLVKVARGLAGAAPEWVEDIESFSNGELRAVIEEESWDAVKPEGIDTGPQDAEEGYGDEPEPEEDQEDAEENEDTPPEL